MARSKCKGCSEPIEWATTRNGKRMPLDPDLVEVALETPLEGIVEIVSGREAHFASCEGR